MQILYIMNTHDETLLEDIRLGCKEELVATLRSSISAAIDEVSEWAYKTRFPTDVGAYTFGYEKPEQVVKAASAWNATIRTELKEALVDYRARDEELNNQWTHELMLAASAANDVFLYGASRCVYNYATGHLHTVLSKEEREIVTQHPELCIITNAVSVLKY